MSGYCQIESVRTIEYFQADSRRAPLPNWTSMYPGSMTILPGMIQNFPACRGVLRSGRQIVTGLTIKPLLARATRS